MIYFDNAATSYPKPDCVKNAVLSFIRDRCGNPGRGGHTLAMKAAETVYETRKKLARSFGVSDPSLVCFTGSCTEALNTAIFGRLSRGDVVITSNLEHNSVRRPLIAAGCRVLEFDALEDENGILEQVDTLISRGARALVCTCASNVLPVVLPYNGLGRLCRDRGVLFIADGAQAAGHADIDVVRDNTDILCIPAHKGLFGIPGCGAMIFSPSYDFEKHRPLLYGGSGVNSAEPGMPDYPPERFEAGTLPTAAIASLSAGLDFVNRVGIGKISQRERDISERILKNAAKYATFYHPAPGSLLCFNVGSIPCERTAELLNKYGVCARAGMHCAPGAHKYTAPDESGAVRISFSYLNSEEEADRFCEILEHISGS